MNIEVIQGDITRQDVEAVVNAANSGMRGGAGLRATASQVKRCVLVGYSKRTAAALRQALART